MLTELTAACSKQFSNFLRFEVNKNGYLRKSNFPFRCLSILSSRITTVLLPSEFSSLRRKSLEMRQI